MISKEISSSLIDPAEFSSDFERSSRILRNVEDEDGDRLSNRVLWILWIP